MSANESHVILYTDGACSGNPGPGGWAALLLVPGQRPRLLVGSHPDTTNNRMELTAVIEGIKAVTRLTPPAVLRCYTDSTYVTTVADPSCRAKANADLVATLRELICTHPVVWHWIRGHNGDVGNTLADTAARKAMECHAPTLTIPLPSDTPLPSPRELTDLIRVSLGRR